VLFDYLRGGPLGTQHKHGTPPCIVLGEAGAGKTSVVYHLAGRAAITGNFKVFFRNLCVCPVRAIATITVGMQAGKCTRSGWTRCREAAGSRMMC
jgi:ABC-type uncharacterized transport system ATPase subunit